MDSCLNRGAAIRDYAIQYSYKSEAQQIEIKISHKYSTVYYNFIANL